MEIENAVRGIALSSGGAGGAGYVGGAKVIDGGAAVSGEEIAALSRAVAEAWQSSGGSRVLFEARLKKQLGLVDGGCKFLAALSLFCVLQTTAWAVIEVPGGQTSTGMTLGSGARAIGLWDRTPVYGHSDPVSGTVPPPDDIGWAMTL